MEQDSFTVDAMHVAVPRAAGIDVHKMELTATVRLCSPGCPGAAMTTRTFGTNPPQLAALAAWLNGHAVEAATMEGTGIYWIAPFRALEDAGIRAELVHAQHVKDCDSRCKVSYAVWQTSAFSAIKGWRTPHFPLCLRISATESASGRAYRACVRWGPFATNSRGNRPSSPQFRTVP